MTAKMIFGLLLLIVALVGLAVHSYKAQVDPENGKEYWRNIKWAFAYALVTIIGIGLSLDYFEPAAPTMEELNDNPAWHNWVAGLLFLFCVGLFIYSARKAFKK